MATVLMRTPNVPSPPVETSHSGLVQPDANGFVTVDVRDMASLTNLGFVLQPGSQGNNFVATSDPGATNDATQGYGVGALWINTSVPRVWVCTANAAGAASWALLYQLA